MHPLAIMGILAALGGLVAAAVALVMVARVGVPLGPVLLGNGIPLLVFVFFVAFAIIQRQRGGKGVWPMYVGFALTVLSWLILNI